MHTGVQAIRRILVLLAVALVALAVVGCGDADDESSEPPGTTSTAAQNRDDGGEPPVSARDDRDSTSDGARDSSSANEPDGGPDPQQGASGDTQSAEEQQVADVVSGMYDDLVTGDAAGVCAVMSKSVREEIAQNVPGGSTEAPEDRTCEESFSKFLDVAARSGILERTVDVEVADVRVRDQRATATVSVSGRAGEVRLSKEDGQWRFGEPPLSGSR